MPCWYMCSVFTCGVGSHHTRLKEHAWLTWAKHSLKSIAHASTPALAQVQYVPPSIHCMQVAHLHMPKHIPIEYHRALLSLLSFTALTYLTRQAKLKS